MPSQGKNLLRTWGASTKIPSILVLIFSVAVLRNTVPVILSAGIALGMFRLSGLSVTDLARHLKAPLILVLFMAGFISLFSRGAAMVQLGPLSVSEAGAQAAAAMFIRVAAIMTIVFITVRTTPLNEVRPALRGMGVPGTLADMGMLTGRYIMATGEDHQRMVIARKLRGYEGRPYPKRFIQVMAPAAATLLIRGFSRSERVFAAMKCRGYGEPLSIRGSSKPDRNGMALTAGVILASALLVTLELTG